MAAAIASGVITLAAQSRDPVPTFAVDPAWPQPLPNRWILGAVAGIAVDSRDHVWMVHRPSTLQPNETRSIWRAAPPVLEFDPDGRRSCRHGAGPATAMSGPTSSTASTSKTTTVWLGGGGEKDAQILKFTRDRASSCCRSAARAEAAAATTPTTSAAPRA